MNLMVYLVMLKFYSFIIFMRFINIAYDNFIILMWILVLFRVDSKL